MNERLSDMWLEFKNQRFNLPFISLYYVHKIMYNVGFVFKFIHTFLHTMVHMVHPIVYFIICLLNLFL